MNVNLNTPQSAPSFGMAIKITPAKEKKVASYLSRNLESTKDTIELNKYYENQKNNPHNIYLSIVNHERNGDERFQAAIGGFTFIKKNPLSAIKKAVSVADSYYKENQAFEAKTAGLSKIIDKIVNKK